MTFVAILQNADDSTLAYLSHTLPCLQPCAPSYVSIKIQSGWSASAGTWRSLDEALRLLTQGNIYIGPHEETAVRAWEALPYRCMDDFIAEMLPQCAAQTWFLSRMDGRHCGLCSPTTTQDSLQGWLDVLTAWTRPVRHDWKLKIQTTLLDSLETPSMESQKMWEEVLRIFELSAAEASQEF